MEFAVGLRGCRAKTQHAVEVAPIRELLRHTDQHIAAIGARRPRKIIQIGLSGILTSKHRYRRFRQDNQPPRAGSNHVAVIAQGG